MTALSLCQRHGVRLALLVAAVLSGLLGMHVGIGADTTAAYPTSGHMPNQFSVSDRDRIGGTTSPSPGPRSERPRCPADPGNNKVSAMWRTDQLGPNRGKSVTHLRAECLAPGPSGREAEPAAPVGQPSYPRNMPIALRSTLPAAWPSIIVSARLTPEILRT